MPRWFLLALLCSFAVVAPARAVIKVLTPLKKVIAETETIFVAEVEKVDAEKPSVVFKFTENLKGKAPAEKFPVNLTGDSFAKKDEHTKVMLDRLAAGRKLLLFTQKIDTSYIAFGFLEGTWFQMKGTKDGDAIRWAFLHCEPYFRRTFKGTTDDLSKVISESLAGKKEPPEPDEKEPHGFGPPVEKKKEECVVGGTLFGVIPSFLVVGPLAILTALFPTLFAGLATGVKRWRAFMIVVSLNSLFTFALYLVSLRVRLPDLWLLRETAAGMVLAITFLGMAWAGLRYRRAAEADERVTLPPERNDLLAVLAFAGIVGVALVLIAYFMGSELVWKAPTREFTAIGVGLAVAAAYTLFRMATSRIGSAIPIRMSVPGELAALMGVFAFTGILLIQGTSKTTSVSVNASDATETTPKLEDATLPYENAEPATAMSAATVTEDKLYLGTTRKTGFVTRGYLLCFDRATGKKLWEFTDVDAKAFYSTPTVVGKKLYVGEGMHLDSDCRLFCIDTDTGKPIWTKPTKSHTEGNPAVSEGKVYFSAGDDGLYCLNAESGADLWHYQGVEQGLHIDTSVTVVNGKVYGGSGYNTFAAFCLDAATGKPVWKKELPLRSFGMPLVLENRVVFGLGTGNLSEDLSSEPETRPKETIPAGMVLALDAATGNDIWKVDLPRSAHTQLAADARAVYATSRDGWLYALDRRTGKQFWRYSFGQPLTAGPVVAEREGFPIAVYSVSADGQVFCHSPLSGKVIWARGISEIAHRKAKAANTPTLLTNGLERQLFVPVTLVTGNDQEFAGVVRFVDRLGE